MNRTLAGLKPPGNVIFVNAVVPVVSSLSAVPQSQRPSVVNKA